MTPELYGTVVILVVLVMLSAFFSASETAFTSANRVKLKTMAQGGNKRAQIALNLAEDYDRLLSTILVGNNVVNIGASSMATGLFLALLSGNQSAATTVSTIVMTIVVLISANQPESDCQGEPGDGCRCVCTCAAGAADDCYAD